MLKYFCRLGDPDLRGLVCNHANKVMRDKVEHDFSSVSAIVTASNERGKRALTAMICRINYW